MLVFHLFIFQISIEIYSEVIVALLARLGRDRDSRLPQGAIMTVDDVNILRILGIPLNCAGEPPRSIEAFFTAEGLNWGEKLVKIGWKRAESSL